MLSGAIQTDLSNLNCKVMQTKFAGADNRSFYPKNQRFSGDPRTLQVQLLLTLYLNSLLGADNRS